MLGLGKPFEPNRWDIECAGSEEEDAMLLASQAVEDHVDGASQRVLTKKQTDWSLSVWAQWASYRAENLIEDDEHLYELNQTLTSMTEECLLFRLPKFIVKVRKSDGGLYPPNSVYQICCGLSRALKLANRIDIDIFNSPKFHQFFEKHSMHV